MAKFTSNGTDYIDAPAGWLKASKDDWNLKLSRTGHTMTWKKTAATVYSGTCRTCAGEVTVGASWSSSPGHDIRHIRCGN